MSDSESQPVWIDVFNINSIHSIASENPHECLLTRNFSVQFWEKLFYDSFFTLPHGNFILIPNPILRFCLDISQHQSRHKKLKRFRKTFSFRVNYNFESSLRAVAEYHSQTSTWLDEACIRNILELQKSSKIQFFSFEVFDNQTGELAAVSVGFACGSNFHDITAATFHRDKRSLGKLLLHLQREILNKCGFRLWYLGFKISYMEEIVGGFEISRDNFFEKWMTNRNHSLSSIAQLESFQGIANILI